MDPSQRPLPEAAAVDGPEPAEIRSVTHLLHLLDKTVKTLTVYPLSNVISQRFLRDVTDRFLVYLHEYGLLRLQVQQHELLYGGQTVYENTVRRENLALKLFFGGIAELAFHDGLEPEELSRFLAILIRNYDPDTADDDLATLLWDASFAHIGFTLVEEADEAPGLPSPGLGRVRTTLRKVLEEEAEDQSSAIDASHPKFGARDGAEVFELSGDEVQRLKAEVASEETTYTTTRLTEMLTAILHAETDFDAFCETLDIMDQLLAHLAPIGDWAHSALVLQALRDIMERDHLSAAHRKRLGEAIDRAAAPDRIQAIETTLHAGGERAGTDLLSFLTLLRRSALRPLCDLLGRLEPAEGRKIVAEALVRLGRGHGDLLASKLGDERWQLVRDLVPVLARIGDPRVVQWLEGLVDHPHLGVRKAVLRVVEEIGQPEARELLVLFLHDEDPGVRVAAMKALAKARYQGARETLAAMILSESREGKSFYETRALCDALGSIGGDEVILTLEELLNKRPRWLSLPGSDRDAIGICAVLALKRMGTPRAVAALEAGQARWSKGVRKACAKALAAMRREAGLATGPG